MKSVQRPMVGAKTSPSTLWPPAVLGLAMMVSACPDGPRAPGDGGIRQIPEEPAPSKGAAAPKPKPPAGPPKRIFAKRFVAKVRTEPSRDAPRIGYLRAGAVLQATTAEPLSGEGCRGGWYELTTGGFVCNGRDVIAFYGDRLPEVRSTQPDRSAKLPYAYGYIRRDRTPLYRRLPLDQEAVVHEGYVIPGQAKAAPPDGQAASEEASPDGGAPAAPSPVQTAGAQVVAAETSPGVAEGDASLDAGPPTLGSLVPEDDSLVMRHLMRGFYVGLDREFETGRRRYYRTYENGFIPFRSVMPVKGSEYRGTELGEDARLPLGVTISRRARRYTLVGEERLRPAREQPEYHTSFHILEEMEVRGRRYYRAADGHVYHDSYVTTIEPRPRPDGIGPDEKWIDVDLSKQTLVAYEGDEPVFATLISSGRVKRPDVPELDHRTPTGTFRISAKHLTHKMDGDNAIDGPYSIDDVPYVMYFELAFALHSAFWHNLFGRPKSHGCVNLAPHDARFLFDWTDPPVPEGWHGAYPTEQAPGTALHIHGETPEG